MNNLIIYTSQNFEIVIKPLVAVFFSVSLLFAHSFRFKFLINRNTIYLTLMLPVTILILTQTIATNLYLTLGLIGALSIVRYRTPVKSQYELGYLFALIAIGIVTGVNFKYALFMTLCLIFFPLVYEIVALKYPSISGPELRFNSDGRVQFNMVVSIDDFDNVELDAKGAKLIRFDKNVKDNQCFFLFSFDTLPLAIHYKKNLKIEPISISIANT